MRLDGRRPASAASKPICAAPTSWASWLRCLTRCSSWWGHARAAPTWAAATAANEGRLLHGLRVYVQCLRCGRCVFVWFDLMEASDTRQRLQRDCVLCWPAGLYVLHVLRCLTRCSWVWLHICAWFLGVGPVCGCSWQIGGVFRQSWALCVRHSMAHNRMRHCSNARAAHADGDI